jgi:hypothetical protein
MRRIMMLAAVATTMVTMVVLTAPVALAQSEHEFATEYCPAHGGTISGPEPGEGPICTFTETTSGIPAEHGFTLTKSQEYRVSFTDYRNSGGNPTPTPVGNPTTVSCQNPGGKDVPLDNPNCTQA